MIADALSRVFPLQSNNSKIKDYNIDVIPIHHITQSAPVSRTRLQEFRLATQSDTTLCSLAKTVHEGWPQSRKDCPKQLLDFWSFRQEISEEDGLLYKNQRLIVPHSERLETSQRSEPLQSHPTPELPWHMVATDLFETKNSKYLLLVDYYSRSPVLCKLGSEK